MYLGVSSDEQRDRQTVRTQEQHAQRWVDLRDVEVVGMYKDDGVSGTIPLERRPAGERLLAAARAGAFDTVVVHELDRLGRDPRHTLNAVHALQAAGMKVRSMTEPFHTNNPAGRFLLAMLGAVADEERALREQLETLERRARAVTESRDRLERAEGLLRQLNRRLDEPLTWETKRAVVEALVEGVRIDTITRDEAKEAVATVTYCFTPVDNRTGTRVERMHYRIQDAE